MKSLQVQIFSAEGPVEEETASINAALVNLPGLDGIIGVMPDHEPMITSLKLGAVRIYGNNLAEASSTVYIDGGIAKITADKVQIVCNYALDSEECEIEYLEKEIEELNKRSANVQQIAFYQELLQLLS